MLCWDFLRCLVDKSETVGWEITVVVYDKAGVKKYIGNPPLSVLLVIEQFFFYLMSSMEIHFN